MKKTLILFLTFIAVATSADAQLRWGVEGSAKYALTTLYSDRRGGFTIGGYGEYQFRRNWYADAGLRLSLDAWQTNWGVIGHPNNLNGEFDEPCFHKVRTSPYTLQLPIHIGYRFGVSDHVKLFAAAGPYIGVGLWGKGHSNLRYYEGDDYRIIDGEVSDIYKDFMHRFQIGAEARIGAELWNRVPVFINVNYQFNNITKAPFPDKKLKYVALGFGYKF